MSPNCFVFVERKTDKLAEYQRDTEKAMQIDIRVSSEFSETFSCCCPYSALELEL